MDKYKIWIILTMVLTLVLMSPLFMMNGDKGNYIVSPLLHICLGVAWFINLIVLIKSVDKHEKDKNKRG